MTWKTKLQKLLGAAPIRGAKAPEPAIPQEVSEGNRAEPERAAITKTIPSTETTGTEALWTRRYRVIRSLGQGGMGSVVLAERKSDSVQVCLKFLHDDADRRTLEQECRALMRLRHPSIVGLRDFSFEDSPPWLVTDYAPGSTLHAYLKQQPLEIPEIKTVLKLILEALAYAHRETVIHRDLKPANIIVDRPNGQYIIRILDFGIAIVDQFDHEGKLTAEGADLTGTVQYMSPEQIQGLLLTPACDIYAVGLMAWEMVMRRSPYQGKNVGQVLLEKTTTSGGLAIEHPPLEVPAALREFIEACTQRDPAARPTAAEGVTTILTA